MPVAPTMVMRGSIIDGRDVETRRRRLSMLSQKIYGSSSSCCIADEGSSSPTIICAWQVKEHGDNEVKLLVISGKLEESGLVIYDLSGRPASVSPQ